ncbi:MAG: helix-turn-helix domain-containing protein [Eubacteriales bacterium]
MSTDKDLKEIREKLNMSQEDVASIMGVSRMSIYRWENGRPIRSKAHLKSIERLKQKVKTS